MLPLQQSKLYLKNCWYWQMGKVKMSLALHCLGVTAYLACIGVHTVRKIKKRCYRRGGDRGRFAKCLGGRGGIMYICYSFKILLHRTYRERAKEGVSGLSRLLRVLQRPHRPCARLRATAARSAGINRVRTWSCVVSDWCLLLPVVRIPGRIVYFAPTESHASLHFVRLFFSNLSS